MIERYIREPMRRVWCEENTFSLWLKIEIAVCEAWHETGLIPAADMKVIKGATFDRQRYEELFAETKHDLIAFTRTVGESLGEAGRWIHHGLTSNDIKDTALAIQMTESIALIAKELSGLRRTVKKQALKYKDVICIGRFHGMHAEPMSFGHKFALWYEELTRHGERLRRLSSNVAVCKLSGPVGSNATLPPQVEQAVGNKLKLTPILANQVIQRDIHADYCQLMALIMATLEKIATEIRNLQRSEIGEVSEPFGKKGFVTKGSSSIPHKRNPELSERICGLARVTRANAAVALENVALWHERDISHSAAERIILPDSSLATDYALALMNSVIADLSVDVERIKENLESGYGISFGPRLMLALVHKGMDRAQAYNLVQELSQEALASKTALFENAKKNKLVTLTLDKDRLREIFDYNWFVRFVDDKFKNLGWTVK